MGYYTKYELDWKPRNPKVSDFLNERSNQFYGVDSEGDTADTVKWYDHHDDMLELSRKFPDILFTLSGKGEEAGDVWKKYYKGGKSQIAQAEIVIAKFDEGKLK